MPNSAIDLASERLKRLEQNEIPTQSKHVDGGGGPPHDSDMEKRIESLEDDMKIIKQDLTDLKVSVAGISGKVDILVAKIPSWWQAPVGAGGLITLMAALIGLAKALHWL